MASTGPGWRKRALSLGALAAQVGSAMAAQEYCPGTLAVKGIHKEDPNKVSDMPLVPNGWDHWDGMAQVRIEGAGMLIPEMGSRAYFAHQCNGGKYSNEDYVAWNLLGRRLKYTADLSGTGCGCNAAMYLVSMRQNDVKSECQDYYCDANSVCGVACAEIDIMEANEHAWHTTLHTQFDHNGMGGGLGGGDGWNGPRDWSSEEYSPGGKCVDTSKPFNVSIEFPVDAKGLLAAVELKLWQYGKPCDVHLTLSEYAGMGDLTEALKAGMTPVVSYWSSDKMLWLDGNGVDGKGPCQIDKPKACPAVAKMFDFQIEHMDAFAELEHWESGGAAGGGGHENPDDFEAPTAKPAKQATCPGQLVAKGFSTDVQLIPTGWGMKDQAPVMVSADRLVTTMGSRAYFGETCVAGTYSNEHYIALQLLGKTLHFEVDLSTTDCGCNSAMYLVSMRQNDQRSDCDDYYCDANSVCGVPCAEIDIMEANQHAWHSTLHTQFDHGGQDAGLGGGPQDGWNGPRTFTKEQYGPGGTCVDTTKSFHVDASFPVDDGGILQALIVKLSQNGCTLTMNIADYDGMPELTAALRSGMTPVVSYWNSEEMLWLDGGGMDKHGFCAKDDPSKCGESVAMWNFSVTTFDRTIEPKNILQEGICEGEWLVNPECVQQFTKDGVQYRGCVELASPGKFWCSHDEEYRGVYSFCMPCKVDVGDMIEPLFPTEEVIVIELGPGSIHPDTTVQPDGIVAEPFHRCGGETRCGEGYRCEEMNEWWSMCVIANDTAAEEQDCYDGWRPHEECVREFDFDDISYIGCTTITMPGASVWCATSARFNGAWKECKPCKAVASARAYQEVGNLRSTVGGSLKALPMSGLCAVFMVLLIVAVVRLKAQGRRDLVMPPDAAMLLIEETPVDHSLE